MFPDGVYCKSMYEDNDQAMWQGCSVILEPGDLFVVVRGEMVHPGGMTVFGAKVPPKFEDKFEGVVFEALEVCNTMVAARAHFPHQHSNRTLSLNVAALETMTVTPRYLEQLLSGRNEAEEEKSAEPQQSMSLVDFIRHIGGVPDAPQGTPQGFVIGPIPPEVHPGSDLPDNLPGIPWEDKDNEEDEGSSS